MAEPTSEPVLIRGRWTRRVLPLALVCVVLLAVPALTSPPFHDDLFHRSMLLGRTPGVHWGALELYDFLGGPTRPASLLRERGMVPWIAPDDLKIRFFRPLSSATLALDQRLFGDRLWPARLHSLGWFFAVLGVAAALYRRFLPAPRAALATIIFAVAAGHGIPIVWIAARHTLVSTALATLALWLHVRWREDGARAGRWLAPLALVAGLFASEMALGAVALIGAWELFGRSDALRRRISAPAARGESLAAFDERCIHGAGVAPRSNTGGILARRAWAARRIALLGAARDFHPGLLAPFAVIAVVYLAAYAALDYGGRGSGLYLVPGDPRVVLVVVRRLMILISEMVIGVPSDPFGGATVAVQTIAALLGAASAVAVWAILRLSPSGTNDRETGAVRWMAVAAIAAALPGTFAPIGGRVLALALVPASGVIAVVLAAGAATVRDRSRRTSIRMAVAVVIAVLAFGHLVAGPVIRLATGVVVARISRELARQATLVPPCPGTLVIVAASDPTIGSYLPAALAGAGRGPELLRLLSMAPADHRIEHVTGTGFDLVALRPAGGWTTWELLYRSAPLRAGARVTLPSFDATVLEDLDGAPVRTRFDFGEPLDSPHLCLFQWRDGRLSALASPKPGDTIELPHQPGPMGF